jgi:type I restriction enzyme M protein
MAQDKGDRPPEETLWKSAIKLRTNMDAASYKHPVLGLIFLKYISDAFDAHRAHLEARYGDATSEDYVDDREDLAELLEDRDEYRADNVFWVPPDGRWVKIEKAPADTVAKTIDTALAAIEAENTSLRGVLPRIYQGLPLRPEVLHELVALIGKAGFGGGDEARDLLGRTYEYFVKNFAREEGINAGAFYTPKSVTRLLVEMLEPYKGRVFDPACGSCGLFIQSARFTAANQGRAADLSIHGQESTVTTERIGRMNLAIHGLSGDIKGGDSLLDDKFGQLKADFVMANPPFNVEEWGAAKVAQDVRWKYGTPSDQNANYAWVQHFAHHLAPHGRAGFVLANGSLTSNQNGEGEIRRRLLREGHIVDCIVALPDKLFYSTGIPVCLWFLDRAREAVDHPRRDGVLFIYARDMGKMVTRTQREFGEEDVATVAGTYHAWRGQGGTGTYEDVPGFCASATLAEIERNEWTLSPGRYVGAAADEESDADFDARLKELVAGLAAELARNKELGDEVEHVLYALGHEL